VDKDKKDWLDLERKKLNKALSSKEFKKWTIPQITEHAEKEKIARTISEPISLEKDKLVPIKIRIVHSSASTYIPSGFA